MQSRCSMAPYKNLATRGMLLGYAQPSFYGGSEAHIFAKASCYVSYLLFSLLVDKPTLASISVVALRQTRLVLGWVTVCGRVNHLGM